MKLEEALKIRREGRVTLFAGGTDLMVKGLRGSNLIPAIQGPVLFLSDIPDLKRWQDEGDTLFFGSCITYTDLLALPILPVLLEKAVSEIGAPGIRNLATLGGNICNASPAGDSLPVLYILNAQVRIAGGAGFRDVPISEFILGPGTTILKQDELVAGIRIPKADLPVHYYRKVGTRKANALSKLSCAGAAKISGEKIIDFRIAFGAVAPTVVRPREIEKKICAMTVTECKSGYHEIVEDALSFINPINDQRSSSEYRRRTAGKLFQQFITSLG